MQGKFGLRCATVFHAGDGNMPPLILFDAHNADGLRWGPAQAMAQTPALREALPPLRHL